MPNCVVFVILFLLMGKRLHMAVKDSTHLLSSVCAIAVTGL